MYEEGKRPRNQTYNLKGKHVYAAPGDRFKAGVSILAGAPEYRADLAAYLSRRYDPMRDLQSLHDVDRYAAVKALRYREDLRGRAIYALENLLQRETEERVALETAGAAAGFGSALGQERIRQVLWGQGRADLRMESVFILTELRNAFAHEELRRVAGRRDLVDEEIRQAAVWGLGKTGLKAYHELLPFLDDEDENVALHAIAAFGEDTPKVVIDALVPNLVTVSLTPVRR